MDVVVEFCIAWWQVASVVCAPLGFAFAFWLIQQDGMRWVADLKDVNKSAVGAVSPGHRRLLYFLDSADHHARAGDMGSLTEL
jgi:hypothetical protein